MRRALVIVIVLACPGLRRLLGSGPDTADRQRLLADRGRHRRGNPAGRNRLRGASRPPTSSNTRPKRTSAPKASSTPPKSRSSGSASAKASCSSASANCSPTPPTDSEPSRPTTSASRSAKSARCGPTRSRPIFSLPDDRGWEMVSPTDKNGGEIQSFGENHGGGVLQAAAQGGQITYTSASSFSGPLGSPGPNQYLSTRGAELVDREHHPADALRHLSGGADERRPLPALLQRPRWGAGQQRPPLPHLGRDPVPGRKRAAAGLRRTGRATATTTCGRARRVRSKRSSQPAPAIAAEDFELEFAGATPDLAHVVLSSCAALTPEATEVPGLEGECDPAEQNLYERSGSTLRLINLLPAQGTGTPGATLAAQSRAISANGTRVYWTDGAALYLRDGTETKKVADGATFETASLDGSLAFYTLGEHLFRYTAATGASTDLTPGGDVKGVVGASEDGTLVYYLTVRRPLPQPQRRQHPDRPAGRPRERPAEHRQRSPQRRRPPPRLRLHRRADLLRQPAHQNRHPPARGLSLRRARHRRRGIDLPLLQPVGRTPARAGRHPRRQQQRRGRSGPPRLQAAGPLGRLQTGLLRELRPARRLRHQRRPRRLPVGGTRHRGLRTSRPAASI